MDIDEGKITLPIHFVLAHPSTSDRMQEYLKIKGLDPQERIDYLEGRFKETEALDRSYQEANRFCQSAKDEFKARIITKDKILD